MQPYTIHDHDVIMVQDVCVVVLEADWILH